MSELVFYGDSVYKFKRIVGKPNFSDQLKTLLNVMKEWDTTWMRQSAWLVVNPIMVYSYGFLFNCTTAGSGLRLNDSPDVKL